MRSKFVAATIAFLSLAACDWQAGQANNAQGNISNDSRADPAANNSMAMLAAPLSKEQALRVMKVRNDGMHAIGDAVKAIHRALGASPDLATVRPNSAKLVQLSKQASGWFPTGTGHDVGKTRAKAEIWQSSEDFAAKVRNFQAAARAFDAAARGNDVAAMNARFADLDGTCKACHQKYRAEEKH